MNGAQTTGAIGSKKPKKGSFLPARFVKCNSPDVIANIVRFNNSQNKITAADFRSNNRIQIRLREEFKAIQNTEYTGGRRGGSADAIKRNPYLLPSDSVAQTLAAFHDAPSISYNKKSEMRNSFFKNILVKHYQFRSPQQMQKRLDVRNSAEAKKNGLAFRHVKESDWHELLKKKE